MTRDPDLRQKENPWRGRGADRGARAENRALASQSAEMFSEGAVSRANGRALESILWILLNGARLQDLLLNLPRPRPAGGGCVTGNIGASG